MPKAANTQTFYYGGFTTPNGTIVPDDFFDIIAPELTEAELRVSLYVIRRTFGFKKDADQISLGQLCNGIKTRDGRVLDKGTGMSRSAVIRGAQGLVDKGILLKTLRKTEDGENETNVYSLRFAEAEQNMAAVEGGLNYSERGGVVLQSDYRSLPKKPPQYSKTTTVVLQEDPQQTDIQQTDSNPSNIRMHSHANLIVDNSTTHAAQPSRSRSAKEAETSPQNTPALSIETNNSGGATIKEWGMEALGDILKKGRGRPSKQYGEEREMILAFIGDFAREFADQAQLKSSVTRALNIYKESGLSPVIFQDRMYQARIKTKEHRAAIKGSRMAYFFACLEQEAGLREAPERSSSDTRQVLNR